MKCGGYSNYYGPCGASDCEDCFGPGAGESKPSALEGLTYSEVEVICDECGFDDLCILTDEGSICECCYVSQPAPDDEPSWVGSYDPRNDDYRDIYG